MALTGLRMDGTVRTGLRSNAFAPVLGSRLAYLESMLMRRGCKADRDGRVLTARATNQSCEAGADRLFAARMNQKAPSDNGICDTQSTIFSGKEVFMRLKSTIYNIYNRLHRKTSVFNDGLHPGESPLTLALPPSATRKRNAAPAGGRSPVDFDLVEAMRLRAIGWSYRRIARQMNNVSRETIRARILDYEAQSRVLTPEPLQQAPIVPVQQSAPVYKPPVTLPAAPKPAPVPVVPLVALPTPFGLDSIPAGCKAFFLVCGEQNAIYARGYAQPAIGIETWHPSYASLPAFPAAERIWVVVTANEENRAFVLSLAADITIRERCVVSVGEVHGDMNHVQMVCKRRLLWERKNHSASIVDPAFLLADRSDFEEAQGFQPIPQPNHTRELEALLAKPPEHERADPLGRSFVDMEGNDFYRHGGT